MKVKLLKKFRKRFKYEFVKDNVSYDTILTLKKNKIRYYFILGKNNTFEFILISNKLISNKLFKSRL